MRNFIVATLAATLLAGCANLSSYGQDVFRQDKPGSADWAPAMPEMPRASNSTAGAIFQSGHHLNLTGDHRARQVGDTLTVVLAERTEASKSSSTDTERSTNVGITAPTVLNTQLDFLNGSVGAESDFSGSGASSQRNQLSGNITVTVYEVLANGNLRVRGEKWLMLNQGEEFVRIAGTVRPIDLNPDNSVPSSKLADARIAYSGKGVLDEANRMGWLARFFQSIFSPL